jgi:hypothetical protein
VPVVVTWDTSGEHFKVTVPTSVTVTLGTYSATCDALSIKNESSGAVCVKQVKIQNGQWTLDGYSSGTIPLRAIDSRYVGFRMDMGDVVLETQSVTKNITSQIWRAGEEAAQEGTSSEGEEAAQEGTSGEEEAAQEGATGEDGAAQEGSTEAAGELLVVQDGDVVIGENTTLSIGCSVRATSVSEIIPADTPETAATIIFIIDWYEEQE